MTDRYMAFTHSRFGNLLASGMGLPIPQALARYHERTAILREPVVVAQNARASVAPHVLRSLATMGVVCTELPAAQVADDTLIHQLVFDATGIESSHQLEELRAFFSSAIRRLAICGRIVVIGRPPERIEQPSMAIPQRALEGFVRALAKELGNGIRVNLLYVNTGAEGQLESPLAFFLSEKSAYVTGQAIRIGKPVQPSVTERKAGAHSLNGKVALVTGAAQGIGRATARILAREGATVIGVDLDSQRMALDAHTSAIGGRSLVLDLADAGAAIQLTDYVADEFGKLDVLVLNAGITIDKRLKNMSEDQWSRLMTVNLVSSERIVDDVCKRSLLNNNSRIVCVSSLCGIAGNAGQTNYATSKAGLLGLVESMAGTIAEFGATINAVAPAYIETQMTDRMPLFAREAYRRMNSLNQGGVPEDVAEAIAWLADPGSTGINGQCLRICGQSFLGA